MASQKYVCSYLDYALICTCMYTPNSTAQCASPCLQVVKSQSIKILGSIDFLGNPVGLLTDVASGVTGLIATQPDVLGLVRDVTHGMSDTTSKVQYIQHAYSVYYIY